jgi:hypothetical protein
MINKLAYFLMLCPLLFSCVKQEVDLVVRNAVIYTVDDQFTIAEAMAIQGDTIVQVGAEHEILNKYSGKTTIDAQKRAIYPGFIDAHCHFYGYGLSLQKVNLVGTKSFEEVIERLIAFHKKYPNEWITGRGWDQNDWAKKDFPTKKEIDSLFPHTPVFIKRIDGHAALANQAALNKANITNATTVEGGIVETKNEALTGILIDNAVDLLGKVIPKPNQQKIDTALIAAQGDCFKEGLTTVDDAGLDKKVIDRINALHKTGALSIKVYAMASPTDENLNYFLENGPLITDRLSVRAFKLYIDGAFGSRGALLLEPYHDAEHHHGLLLTNHNEFKSLAERIYQADFQLCSHAIGDSANRIVLNVYGELLKEVNDKRWRIEHAQLVHPNDLPRFRQYTIIPSVQPTHATSDMYWAKERVGNERIEHAYAYKKLMEQNGLLPLGTDFPVEQISPLHTFYAAVARKDHEGYPEKGFNPENKLSRKEALKGMTIWAAISNFEEQQKGSLEAGKAADFVLLNQDIMQVPETQLLNSKVLYTVVNGKVVYKSN